MWGPRAGVPWQQEHTALWRPPSLLPTPLQRERGRESASPQFKDRKAEDSPLIRTERSPAEVTQMVGDGSCESHSQFSPLSGLGQHGHNLAGVERVSVDGSPVSLECFSLPLSLFGSKLWWEEGTSTTPLHTGDICGSVQGPAAGLEEASRAIREHTLRRHRLLGLCECFCHHTSLNSVPSLPCLPQCGPCPVLQLLPVPPWALGSDPAALPASELSAAAAPIAFLPGKKMIQLGPGSKPSGSRALVSPAPCTLSSLRKESIPTTSLDQEPDCPAPWTKNPWDIHSCATLTFPSQKGSETASSLETGYGFPI